VLSDGGTVACTRCPSFRRGPSTQGSFESYLDSQNSRDGGQLFRQNYISRLQIPMSAILLEVRLEVWLRRTIGEHTAGLKAESLKLCTRRAVIGRADFRWTETHYAALTGVLVSGGQVAVCAPICL
jgi:hypothetical protein